MLNFEMFQLHTGAGAEGSMTSETIRAGDGSYMSFVEEETPGKEAPIHP